MPLRGLFRSPERCGAEQGRMGVLWALSMRLASVSARRSRVRCYSSVGLTPAAASCPEAGCGRRSAPLMRTDALTDEQLEDLMIAVHRNARSLADDAQMLLDAGRFARAYAIAELGAEELGKLLML